MTPQESNRLARSLCRIMQDAGEDLRIFVCPCGYVAFRIGHHADLADRGRGWEIEPHAGCHGCGSVPPCPACGLGAEPRWAPLPGQPVHTAAATEETPQHD